VPVRPTTFPCRGRSVYSGLVVEFSDYTDEKKYGPNTGTGVVIHGPMFGYRALDTDVADFDKVGYESDDWDLDWFEAWLVH
jgi:hypothetical protein